MNSLTTKKQPRVNSTESEPNSNQIRDDFLDVLEDSEFIKTFETEISKLPKTDSVSNDIGFLFEASDDELGLPPTELTQSESVGLLDSVDEWGFNEQISGYELFEYGFGYIDGCGECDDEYLKLDGLFDHTDTEFGFGFDSQQPETTMFGVDA